MTVYVDSSRWSFGRMIMCHCWADNRDELFAMMNLIGVPLRHFQTSWPHFDICKEKRALAVSFGAVETDSRAAVRYRNGL